MLMTFISAAVVLTLFLRLTAAGFCTQTYSCSSTCKRSTRYTTACGLFGWGRCARYRSVDFTCTKTCYRSVCCSGYTGSSCNTPICHGLTNCYNGGTCVSPNNCRCVAGFIGLQCQSDINECEQRTAGCAENCTNTFGSFKCSCIRPGYVIGSDGKSCVDEDECQTERSECQHECSNTEGSYTCSCRQGYALALDKKLCEDVDECANGEADCDHFCSNNIGSFTCSCRTGFQLQADGKTCEDIHECANTSLCDQICVEEDGMYSCACEMGFRLQADGRSCSDVEECEEGISGCSHTCSNTVGSFLCDCLDGFTLDDDGKSCINIDDCKDGVCENDGTCIDGVSSFSCQCKPGYTGEFCQTDVNECHLMNGGCQDICINTEGSFMCSCGDDRELQPDKKSCKGGKTSMDTVFDRHLIPGKRLPKGCNVLYLSSCTEGSDISLLLSSTSHWYKLRSDPNIIFTYGIVFAEINSLSLPISLSGVDIKKSKNDFSVVFDVKRYRTEADVSMGYKRSNDCLSFDFTPKDVYDFVSYGSFFKTFFSKIEGVLPDWLKLSQTNSSLLEVQDMQTELIYGREVYKSPWCQGAPIVPDHLYSVFQFGSSFSLSVYNDRIDFPKPLSGYKYCLMVDICQNYGGSVFLMVPKESENILTELNVFKTLHERHSLLLRPRGIGLSVVKGLDVRYNQKELQLWNGDATFTYPVFDMASLWIGGDVTWNVPSIEAFGTLDIYASVPSPDRILTAMFIDQWNVLIQAKAGMSVTFELHLFGEKYPVTLGNLVTVTTDMYMSVGGTKERAWCGEESNPPGIFLSAKLNINPFQNVPILKEWVVETVHILYAFVTIDVTSELSSSVIDDIIENLTEINGTINRFSDLVKNTLQTFEVSVRNKSTDIMLEMQIDVSKFQLSLSEYLDKQNSFLGDQALLLTKLWKHVVQIEKHISGLEDITNFNPDKAVEVLIFIIKSGVGGIKIGLGNAVRKLSNQLPDGTDDISGFGMKYTTTLVVFGLKIIGVDIEIVSSRGKLMECSRFHKVSQLLKGKPAVRFLVRGSSEQRLNFFVKLEIGFGGGGAFGIDTYMVILQLNAFVNIIGIKTTGDLFISQSGLHIFLEGNVWGFFLAQIDIFAEVGKPWYQLTFTLEGRFVAKAKRKRQIQTDGSSFQASYLNSLTKVLNVMADEADKRISEAQRALSAAQSLMSTAQNWLEDRKKDVQKANIVFDDAVSALEWAKHRLEDAKIPFKKAMDKLNQAQRNVDNLCKIRSCRKICIPGLKCKWCKRGWFGYPCCRFTSCMISFPDLVCILANSICMAIRAIAFAVLEAAKIFVRIPMLVFDVAKVAVSAAQFAVDKSRVVLQLAEGTLELATFALDVAKRVLELAKLTLEAVKFAIRIAAKVLEFVIQYGLKSLIDVRNCGFKIEVSTTDLPVFDVSCEINAFMLGWKKVQLRINFKNPWQTIWQAAKATIKVLTGELFGRKRREISFGASANMHRFYRYVRQSGEDPMNMTLDFLNETLDIVSMTYGFNSSVVSDYDNRVLLFEQKCIRMNSTLAFLNDIWATLFDLTNDTKHAIDEASAYVSSMENYNLTDFVQNMTLENADISEEYAYNDYNLTRDELEVILEDTKRNASTDPYLLEVAAVREESKTMVQSELESIEHSALLESWILLMENRTNTFFSKTECVELRDCILYATSELYDLYIAEEHPNITEITQAILYLEDIFIDIIQNTSQNIIRIYNLSISISNSLKLLDDLNVFCSEPPKFYSPLKNTTVVRGQSTSIQCHAHGNPQPHFLWFKDNEIIVDVTSHVLMITNASDVDIAAYKCMAGNVVANLTSNEAYLILTESFTEESEITDKRVIIYYIPTLAMLGANMMFLALQIFFNENKCMKLNDKRTFVLTVAVPALTICLMAVASQFVIYFIIEIRVNAIKCLLLPILALVAIEVASVGALSGYAYRKRHNKIYDSSKIGGHDFDTKATNGGITSETEQNTVENNSKATSGEEKAQQKKTHDSITEVTFVMAPATTYGGGIAMAKETVDSYTEVEQTNTNDSNSDTATVLGPALQLPQAADALGNPRLLELPSLFYASEAFSGTSEENI